ncbi:VRR-NUC domain-containing protein [Bacillaceae bacterium W0354]
MKEKTIENQIKGYLDQIGAWYIKTHGNMFSKAGTPDIIACINGTFVGIEVKKPGGQPSALQLAQIKRIEQSGGISFVADSLKHCQMELRRHGLI